MKSKKNLDSLIKTNNEEDNIKKKKEIEDNHNINIENDILGNQILNNIFNNPLSSMNFNIDDLNKEIRVLEDNRENNITNQNEILSLISLEKKDENKDIMNQINFNFIKENNDNKIILEDHEKIDLVSQEEKIDLVSQEEKIHERDIKEFLKYNFSKKNDHKNNDNFYNEDKILTEDKREKEKTEVLDLSEPDIIKKTNFINVDIPSSDGKNLTLIKPKILFEEFENENNFMIKGKNQKEKSILNNPKNKKIKIDFDDSSKPIKKNITYKKEKNQLKVINKLKTFSSLEKNIFECSEEEEKDKISDEIIKTINTGNSEESNKLLIEVKNEQINIVKNEEKSTVNLILDSIDSNNKSKNYLKNLNETIEEKQIDENHIDEKISLNQHKSEQRKSSIKIHKFSEIQKVNYLKLLI